MSSMPLNSPKTKSNHASIIVKTKLSTEKHYMIFLMDKKRYSFVNSPMQINNKLQTDSKMKKDIQTKIQMNE